MTTPIIRFNRNYNNKLDCRIFTTVRKSEDADYYTERIGEIFEIWLPGSNSAYCSAKLLDVIHISLHRLAPLEKVILQLDTGLWDINEIRELLRGFGIEDDGILLVFERA